MELQHPPQMTQMPTEPDHSMVADALADLAGEAAADAGQVVPHE